MLATRYRWPCVLLMSLLLALPAGAHAGPQNLFRQHYEQALGLYTAGRLEESLEEFKAAYALRKLPRLLVNMGRIYRKLGHLKEAVGLYDLYLRMDPEAPPELRATVEQDVAEITRTLDEAERVASQAPPKQVGAPAPPAARSAEQTRRPIPALLISAMPGQPKGRPLSRRWWLWGSLAAVVAAGAVTGAVLATRPSAPVDPEGIPQGVPVFNIY